MQHVFTPMNPSQTHVEHQVTGVSTDFGVTASSTQNAAFKFSCLYHIQEEYDSSLYLCWLGFMGRGMFLLICQFDTC